MLISKVYRCYNISHRIKITEFDLIPYCSMYQYSDWKINLFLKQSAIMHVVQLHCTFMYFHSIKENHWKTY